MGRERTRSGGIGEKNTGVTEAEEDPSGGRSCKKGKRGRISLEGNSVTVTLGQEFPAFLCLCK